MRLEQGLLTVTADAAGTSSHCAHACHHTYSTLLAINLKECKKFKVHQERMAERGQLTLKVMIPTASTVQTKTKQRNK